MNKQTIIARLLVPALCLGLLSGCGKQTETTEQSPAAPEREVYTAAFRTVTLPKDGQADLWAAAEDGFYFASYEKIAEGQAPEGVIPEYEGQYDVYGSRLYFAGEDGQIRRLEGYTPLETPADDQGRKNYSASADLAGLFVTEEGLLTLENVWESWFTGPEGMTADNEEYWDKVQREDRYYLRSLDREGREQSRAELRLQGLNYGYLDTRRAAVDGEGRIYMGADETILVFAPDGALLAEIPAGWAYGFTALTDGREAVGRYGDRGLMLSVLDADAGGLGEEWSLSDFPDGLYPGSGDYACYYVSGTALYGFRTAEGESKKLLDFLDCDLIGTDFLSLSIAADGAMRGVYREEGEAEPLLVTLGKSPESAAPQKTVLTLGTLSPEGAGRAVLQFNRSHEDVRIRVLDYSDYVSGEDYEAGLLKLSTEIMSGSMPDLLYMENLPYRQMAAKGLLEDLYPWLDADKELKREDFFQNVLAAAEVGGRLCQAAPGFSILTLMGAASVVGEEPGWTYEELTAALEKMPEGCTVMGPYVDRSSILLMCTLLDMDNYLDWETGECRFDSPEFLKLLAFCKSFPQDMDYEPEDGENDMTRVAAGRQMLIQTGVFNMEDVLMNEQMLGGDATYIGFPTMHGVGNILSLNGACAMSSSCRDKEAAWDFLRLFLMEDYQLGDETIGLPLNRAAFGKKLDEAMEEEYLTDEQGRYLLDANGEKIPTPKMSFGLSMDGDSAMDFDIYAMSREQADKLLAVIDSADRCLEPNMSVYTIVKEEAQAYFADQKSAEEVARLIQSKISLYVNEQR